MGKDYSKLNQIESFVGPKCTRFDKIRSNGTKLYKTWFGLLKIGNRDKQLIVYQFCIGQLETELFSV